jgi:tape measure domain-containing protein
MARGRRPNPSTETPRIIIESNPFGSLSSAVSKSNEFEKFQNEQKKIQEENLKQAKKIQDETLKQDKRFQQEQNKQRQENLKQQKRFYDEINKQQKEQNILEKEKFRNRAEATQAFIQTGAALYTIGQKIYDFSEKVVQKAASFEKVKKSVIFGTGDITSFNRIVDLSEKYGFNLESMAESYGHFAASTKGTKLEGKKTEEIFESVARAGRVLNLTTDDMNGSFRALSQMISKNRVGSEELRHQLGDRLTGSFKIAADAIGVTTDQLDAMLKKGEVVALDLIPKFAKELDKFTGGEDASNSLAAKIERLSNSWDKLLVSIGNTKFYQTSISSLTDVFKGLGSGISGDFSNVDMSISERFRQKFKDIESFYTELKKNNPPHQRLKGDKMEVYYDVPKDLKQEAVRLNLATYGDKGKYIVKRNDVVKAISETGKSLQQAKYKELNQMITEGNSLADLFDKIQKGDYTTDEFRDFNARISNFYAKRNGLVAEFGTAFTDEAFKKTFTGAYDFTNLYNFDDAKNLSPYEQYLNQQMDNMSLMDISTTEKANIRLEKKKQYERAMNLVNKIPPPKPDDLKTNNNNTTPPPGGEPEDRIVASQPKVVNINILTGRDASLIQQMDISEIRDKSNGEISPEFIEKVTNVLYKLMSDSSQLLMKQVIK